MDKDNNGNNDNKGNNGDNIICDKLKLKIKNELVDPTYYRDIKDNLERRLNWKRVGDVFETTSKVFIGISSLLAFAAGFFNYGFLSFISGCFSVSSLVFLQFSSYSMKESKESNEIANKILKQLGIHELENIATDINTDESEYSSNPKNNDDGDDKL